MSWRKDELVRHDNGYQALAIAVLKRWQLDGKPAGDKKAVDTWKQLVVALDSKECAKTL